MKRKLNSKNLPLFLRNPHLFEKYFNRKSKKIKKVYKRKRHKLKRLKK